MNEKEEEHLQKKNEVIKPQPINYFFFGTLFVTLCFLYCYHVFLIEPSFTFSRYFFGIYAFGECLLQVLGLVCICAWIQAHCAKPIKTLFIILTFIFFISQGIDFFLERLMSFSIWYGFDFVIQETLTNFMEILKATNISFSTWILGALFVAVLMFLGLFFYQLTEKWSMKRPLFFSKRFVVSLGCSLCFFLFLWDSVLSPFAQSPLNSQYFKTLPWKTTFFPPSQEIFVVNGFLKDPWKNKECFADLDSSAFSLKRKPDIFLFVTESLREDFITKEIAPSLHQFKTDNISFPLALSNANATQISWFSLFYSLLPFHFSNYQADQWKKGSLPLVLLKKMGYDIRLYTSSRLNFYEMNNVLFGDKTYLLNKTHNFSAEEGVLPYQADAKSIGKLCEDLLQEDKVGGRVFIVFLESTHFGYSWPQDTNTLFSPINDNINYLEVAYSQKNLEKIKNRYRNAVHYVDGLFGKFLQTLKGTDSWKESVIVFTADHGEEFFDHGHIFHATELSHPQLHVPLYYKLGANEVKEQLAMQKMTSHIDVFPSILHYLVGEDYFGETLQGHSLLGSKQWPYVVGARYNAGKSPFEFFIHNGSFKLIAQFGDKSDIFHSRSLHILAAKDEREENVVYSLSSIRQQFGEALDMLFSP